MSDEIVPAWSERFLAGFEPATPDLGVDPPISRSWAYGDASGRGVRVAVVDSGVNADHPAIGGVSQAVAVELDPDAEHGVRIVEGPHEDLTGHGTACAGVIRSLAPEVEIVSVRVLGANLKGSAVAFAYGLDWCVQHGVDVVNLSLSTSNERFAETFHELVDEATWRRTVLVSAMNNVRKRTIPSEFSGVLSVACGPGDDRERIFHHPEGPGEWAAPGIDVEVPWGTSGTMRVTGNSFAAPVVAAHAARVLGAHPGLTPWQVRTILAAIASPPRPVRRDGADP